MTEFDFAGSDGTYALFDAEARLILDAARVRWIGDDLFGQVTVTHEGKTLAPMNFVFTKGPSRKELVEMVGGEDAQAAVNELCQQVIRAERTSSSPVVCLRDAEKPTEDREYKIPVLPPLPRTSMAIWFGDGGTGKSLLALNAAGELAKQGVRTLYLDWEWEVGEHRIRLERLFGGEMPAGLYYWQCERPLPQMTDAIKRVIREQKIEYVVVDSIAYACGGDAESSEIASRYKVATQAFGVGSLHLAHVTKNGGTEKPFGSAFWHNGARSTWYLEQDKAKSRTGGGVIETALKWYHRKSNLGPKEPLPRLIRFIVEDESNRITVTSSDDAAARGEARIEDRLRSVLANGPLKRDDVYAALSDLNSDSVKRTINRGLKSAKGKLAWLHEDREGIGLIESRTKAA